MKKVIGLVFFIFISINSFADEIRMASGDWCPYVCDERFNNGMHGYLPDISKIIFEKAGHSFKMEYMSFVRAIIETEKGKYNGIPGVYRTDVPHFTFPVKPQGMGGNALFVWHTNQWRYEGVDSLKKLKKIGMIRGYSYGTEFDQFIQDNPKVASLISGDNPQTRSMKMLQLGRINAWIEDIQVAKYNIMKSGLQGKVIFAGSLEKLPVFIALSPAIKESPAYGTMIVEGVERLRKTGELQKILKRYGLNDWK